MTEVDNFLRKQVHDGRTPSVQYIIFDGHTEIFAARYGFSNLANRQEVCETTTYQAYSVTKTFTALAVLQLARRKKLDIDRPAAQYLPDFPYPSGITIRHLLAHSAGIPNPFPLRWVHLESEHGSFDRHDFFVRTFSANKAVRSGPNEKYAYSNLGYVLLGELIEVVSGLTYETYVRENILNVLGPASGELDFVIGDGNSHAKGYHDKYSLSGLLLGFLIDRRRYVETTKGKWITFRDCYVNGASYGGLTASARALAAYVQELLRPDCRLIDEGHKKMMFTENHTNNRKATGMCLGWFTGRLGRHRYFSHAGGGAGHYCEIRIYPDLGAGSVVMFNRTGLRDERYLDKLDKYTIIEKQPAANRTNAVP